MSLGTRLIVGFATAASTVGSVGAQKTTEPHEESLGTASAVPYCPPALADGSGGGCIGASSVPGLGMLYPLSNDFFVDAATGFVGLATTFPEERLHVNGTLRMNDKADGVVFSPSGSLFQTTRAMISMSTSGFGAFPDRMVIAREPDSLWGLEYRDSPINEFVFRSTLDDVLTIDLASEDVSVDTGDFGVSSGGIMVLQPNAGVRAVHIQHSSVSSSGADILGVRGPNGMSGGAQFIQCERQGTLADDIEFRVDGNGNTYADGVFTGGGADFAEMIAVGTGAHSVEPGDLLTIDPERSRSVVRSTQARSTLVIGVYSTQPGFVGTEQEFDRPDPIDGTRTLTLDHADMALDYDEVPVAIVGIVPVKASAENGAIRMGDLLVSSSTPGHVMRDVKPESGTIVGKALDSLEEGRGVITMLVTLQ